MQQVTYILGEDFSFSDAAHAVAALPAYQSATSRLLVVFDACNECHEDMLPLLTEAHALLPDIQVVGMTMQRAKLAWAHAPSRNQCTFLLFERSELIVRAYNCHDVSPGDAAEKFVAELSLREDVRGILCFSSRATLSPEPFIDVVAAALPDVPIFGALAGARYIDGDRSLVFYNEGLLDCAVLAVAFCGADLHVFCGYSLGWRPIGKDLVITAYEGHGIVATIDGSPAASIYRRYLDVTPDEFFFEHVCPFPLLEQHGSIYVARTPLGYTPTGKLRFSMDLPKGTEVRLSYTKPEYLLQESLASANELASFAPQATMIFTCLSRRVQLGDELADRELGYYCAVCPSLSIAYGYGEVLRVCEGASILNNSIVTVGLREGEAREVPASPFVDHKLETHGESIPLSERLVAFLEATTAELNDTIAHLARLAEYDQLTGVYNRRRMDDLIRYELSKRNAEDELVLIIYDVDYFKRVNDTFGHDVGDIVLRDVTRIAKSTVRAYDKLGRWGGEEFLCLLTNTSLENGELVAERIRSNIENNSFGLVGQVTVSVGVTCAIAGDTLETLFARADEALYAAKRSGRNRVCVR